MLYFRDGIIVANSKKEAIQKCLAKPNGIRLYLLFQGESVFLTAFYSNHYNLKPFGFTLDDLYCIKPVSSLPKSIDFNKDKVAKLLKFKNSKAVNELKTYIAESSNNYDDGYWFAIFENQAFIVSYEKEPGFVKIPARPLYKDVQNFSGLKLAIKKIQRSFDIANLDELNKVCKLYFGSTLKEEAKTEDFELDYTEEFINDQFDLFNERYFDNKLPKIPCFWKGLKNYGITYHKTYPDHLDVVKILINKKIPNYREFRDTMIHEMCHAYCYLNIPKKDFDAANLKFPYNSIQWKKYLEITDETAHNGRWLDLINSLNNKFPELHLKRLGSSHYEDRDESGNIKQEVIDNVAKGHLLLRNLHNKKFLTFASEILYQKIKELNKNVSKDLWPWGGEWTEYEFDPKLLSNFITKPADDLRFGYKYKVLKLLKNNGVIKSAKILK